MKSNAKNTLYAQVVLAIGSDRTQDSYTYAVPLGMVSEVKIGSLVLVSVRKSLRAGIVVGLSDTIETQDYKIKDIISVYGPDRMLDETGIDLARWISKYYCSSLYSAIRLLFWDIKTFKISTEYQIIDSEKMFDYIYEKIGLFGQSQKKINTETRITKRKFNAILKSCEVYGNEQEIITNELLQAGFIKPVYQLHRGRQRDEKLAYLPAEDYPPGVELNEDEENIFLTVQDQGCSVAWEKLKKEFPKSRKHFKSLIEKGFLIETHIPADRNSADYEDQVEFDLTREQKKAVKEISKAIEEDKSETFLIEGITGSGKTQIYIESAKLALKKGSVIVLVPEIVLTLQIVRQFRKVFGDCLFVLHSGLGQSQLKRNWEVLRQSEHRVVIGPRSALFAPLSDVKLIIIDEEHEPAYKQERAPRYHARDVARKMAGLRMANLILGSATPSIESRFKAEHNRYNFIELRKRIHKGGLPDVKMLQLKNISAEGPQFLSSDLIFHINKTLDRNKQVLLFINQRGFSPSLLCMACGHTPACPSCNIAYTYHATKNMLLCHHCDGRIRAPKSCSACGSTKILKLGFGTQRVEEEVIRVFPDASVYRLDRDVASRGGIEGGSMGLMKKFFDEHGDILIGTQMIGKGLDLPDVELVGIVNADTSLNLPDFRAAERTFQLITQVAGRAGRRETKGTVILQTYKPGHYAVEAARRQDYEEFYQKELVLREHLGYPPYVSLARIIFRGKNDGDVRRQIKHAVDILIDLQNRKAINLNTVLGPSPAPLQKLADYYRHHIILKAGRVSELINAVNRMDNRMKLLKGVRLDVDINPLNML